MISGIQTIIYSQTRRRTAPSSRTFLGSLRTLARMVGSPSRYRPLNWLVSPRRKRSARYVLYM